MSAADRQERDGHLEMLRGLAAISVMLWHSMLALFPEYSGIYPQLYKSAGLAATPLYGLIFGTSAVAFFFVLSGYVLTRPLFAAGRQDILIRNAVKRWPRLAMPVGIVVLLAWSGFPLHLYQYEAAAGITNSPWLATFGGAYPFHGTPFTPTFRGAFSQGFFGTFFYGDSTYDSSTWSMSVELIGSLVAFGVAFLFYNSGLKFRILLTIMLFTLATTLNQGWYVAFIGGVILAAYLPHHPQLHSIWPAALAILLAMFLAGYSEVDSGIFHPIHMILGQTPLIYVWTIAAILLIAATTAHPRIKSALSNRIGGFLGWISFPLYLLQVPIICSVDSWVYLSTRGHFADPRILAASAGIVTAIMASVPLAMLNDRWLSLVNRFSAWVTMPTENKITSAQHAKAFD